ncbi:MAG: hypothetical protein KC680_00230 [Candidatus Peregrinibacteria bacterium]|nr:hypothetical protein [Candidatus Peregrinibacteria bacterium]MCB9807945.1 hypothetical protein [Candidatus Peribacteria bacterium]
MRVVSEIVERRGKKTVMLQGFDHAILRVLYDRSISDPIVQKPKGVLVSDPYTLRVTYRVVLEFVVERIDLQYRLDKKSKWTTLFDRRRNRIGKRRHGNTIMYLHYLGKEEAREICAELSRQEAIAAYRRLAKES